MNAIEGVGPPSHDTCQIYEMDKKGIDTDMAMYIVAQYAFDTFLWLLNYLRPSAINKIYSQHGCCLPVICISEAKSNLRAPDVDLLVW